MTTTIFHIPCGSRVVRTTVTSVPSAARGWVHVIHRCGAYRRGRLVAGLGVQWVSGQAATLQLCVGSRCLVFQLRHAGHCPDALRGFLLDSNVILVALWDRGVAGMLMGSRHALQVGWLVDARMAAHQLRGCGRGATMGQLAEELLGIRGMSKDEAVGCSDWEDEELTGEQVEYACHDVLLAYLIALELRFWPE